MRKLVYKLYDLTPEEIKIVEGENENADEIKKIVKALVETLITNNIAVDKIILYGS